MGPAQLEQYLCVLEHTLNPSQNIHTDLKFRRKAPFVSRVQKEVQLHFKFENSHETSQRGETVRM